MIEKKPLLSIVIPVFNTPKSFLDVCLNSCMLPKALPVEVIIVDDGSAHALANYLDNFASLHPDVKVIHKKNGGQNSARNIGIEAANGSYIQFIDSDDCLTQCEEMKLLRLLTETEPDILAFGSRNIETNGKTLSSFTFVSCEKKELSKTELIIRAGALWQYIFKATLLKKSDKSLNECIKIGEDLASVVPIILDANKIIGTNITPYNYVSRKNSIVNTPNKELLNDILNVFDILRKNTETECSEIKVAIEWLAVRHILFFGIKRVISWDGPFSKYIHKYNEYMKKYFPNWKSNPWKVKDSIVHKSDYFFIIHRLYLIYWIVKQAMPEKLHALNYDRSRHDD